MRRLVAGLAATAVAALSLVGFAPVASAGPVCEPVATFGLGGHNDPAAAVYGGGARPVHYSASIWPFGGWVTYDASVAEGARNMIGAVNDYAAHCPGAIVVKGYSEGARAAGDALEVLDDGPHRHRISGVLYADPKQPGGIEDALQGLSVFGMTMTGPRYGFNVPVRSECNPTDGVCNFPFPENFIGTAQNVNGYLTGAHAYNVND